LAISVQPDTTVKVTAPHSARVEVVKAKVRKRAMWVLRQQAFFRTIYHRRQRDVYVSGETVPLLGTAIPPQSGGGQRTKREVEGAIHLGANATQG